MTHNRNILFHWQFVFYIDFLLLAVVVRRTREVERGRGEARLCRGRVEVAPSLRGGEVCRLRGRGGVAVVGGGVGHAAAVVGEL